MYRRLLALILALSAVWVAPVSAGEITVYSGRAKTLVEPLIEKFKAETGIEIKARYGDSAELAATILEEGDNSPADVFWSQDAGALGALALADKLGPLDPAVLDRVDARFRSPQGVWVGTSGRARVVVYNTNKLKAEDLPASILDFTDPKWSGRLGWAPTNGSFQSFITAMRRQLGEDRTREWLKGVKANEPRVYSKNSGIVAAVISGEVDAGFVNHYYLYEFLRDQGPNLPAANFYTAKGDAGSLVNAAGVGVLRTAAHAEDAARFVDYLLKEEAQRFFADETFEYPLIAGIAAAPSLKPLSEIESPIVDLSQLDDLAGTLHLLQDTGILE